MFTWPGCGLLVGGLKAIISIQRKLFIIISPWPDATDRQRQTIEKLAQAILDARALYPESSLAALYDPLTMPLELIKAHQNLDRAVMKLYGFSGNSEAGIVAALMERYQALAG